MKKNDLIKLFYDKKFFGNNRDYCDLGSCSAQGKYFTKTGKISFFSKTDLENIDAHNRSVSCVLDTKTGNLQFSVLMKGFEFKKALMQEHFNEDYVESDKYPEGRIQRTDRE